MRKYDITVTISEQGHPDQKISASLEGISQDRLMSSLMDTPLILIVRALNDEATKENQS